MGGKLEAEGCPEASRSPESLGTNWGYVVRCAQRAPFSSLAALTKTPQHTMHLSGGITGAPHSLMSFVIVSMTPCGMKSYLSN